MHPDSPTRSWWPIAAVALAGAVLVGLVAVSSLLPALAALTLILLPTYLLTWPLLRPQLGFAGAFTIAGGLSIGMVAIAGLVLNLLPWGLQAASWLAYIGVLILVGLVLGRRPWAFRPKLAIRTQDAVLVGIGGGMMLSALIFARMFAAYPAESFTQLWITPAAEAPASSVAVNIRSGEQAVTTYRVEVRRDGSLVQSWPDIRLASGETWSMSVAVGAGRIEAQLFRDADPVTPYRHVTIQLDGAIQLDGTTEPVPGQGG